MGKVLIIKGADFSAVSVGAVQMSVDVPQIQIDATTKLVTLSAASGLDIYYTTNGSTPTTSSTKYTAPFSAGNNCTVKAISSNGSTSSSVPKLTISTSVKSDGSIDLSVSSSVSGTIRYATGDNVPTASSTAYSQAITGINSACKYTFAVYSGNNLVSEVSTVQFV